MIVKKHWTEASQVPIKEALEKSELTKSGPQGLAHLATVLYHIYRDQDGLSHGEAMDKCQEFIKDIAIVGYGKMFKEVSGQVEKKTELKKQWEAQHQGLSNAHKISVVDELKATYVPASNWTLMPPKEAVAVCDCWFCVYYRPGSTIQLVVDKCAESGSSVYSAFCSCQCPCSLSNTSNHEKNQPTLTNKRRIRL